MPSLIVYSPARTTLRGGVHLAWIDGPRVLIRYHARTKHQAIRFLGRYDETARMLSRDRDENKYLIAADYCEECGLVELAQFLRRP